MKLSCMKVLLAEDNPTNQLVAMRMLEALGAEVTLAEDGAQALEIAGRAAFDFMLVDIEMPRVSGIDVIRRIRARPAPEGETPIIALTAYVMREHREPILSAGADGIIPKPIVSIEQLGDDILAMVATRRGRGGGAANRVTPPSGAAIDMAVFSRLSESIGTEAMATLLTQASTDLESAGGAVARALPGADLGEVRAASHIVVSVAGVVGATGLQTAAAALNRAAGAGDRAAVERDAPGMLELIASVRRDLDARRQGR